MPVCFHVGQRIRLFFPRSIGYRQPRSSIGLDAVLRNRITQSVRYKPLHSFDGLWQKVGRNCHQQLVVEHTPVAPLRIAWDRKTRFAGFERATSRVGASRFSDGTSLKFAIAGPLKAVDENDHLARRRVEETNIGGIESS
jgi:hypothetical protein